MPKAVWSLILFTLVTLYYYSSCSIPSNYTQPLKRSPETCLITAPPSHCLNDLQLSLQPITPLETIGPATTLELQGNCHVPSDFKAHRIEWVLERVDSHTGALIHSYSPQAMQQHQCDTQLGSFSITVHLPFVGKLGVRPLDQEVFIRTSSCAPPAPIQCLQYHLNPDVRLRAWIKVEHQGAWHINTDAGESIITLATY